MREMDGCSERVNQADESARSTARTDGFAFRQKPQVDLS
jgi:hypothetical protein